MECRHFLVIALLSLVAGSSLWACSPARSSVGKTSGGSLDSGGGCGSGRPDLDCGVPVEDGGGSEMGKDGEGPGPDGAVDAGGEDGGADQDAGDGGHPDGGGLDGGGPDGGGPDGGDPDGGDPDGGVPGPGCLAAEGADSAETAVFTSGVELATVELVGDPGCRRSYRLATSVALRDGQPANPRLVTEEPGLPALRTRHAWFDALYALALAEMRENSVDRIHDPAFTPYDCPAGGCFETGRLWSYVWTRDISYSVDLALAALDPPRARNSLLFKLSARRDGGGDPQIVQDTGSGGSYPISSDRVVWALGARALLAYLDDAERAAFLQQACPAIANTLAHDREVVFDEASGLYRGEQSFLDWREQSYPGWTAQDTVHIGMSRALSTNAAHLLALELAAACAQERGEAEAQQRFASWAGALREAMRRRFWLPGPGQLSSFISTELDPAPVQRYDLLGSALAVLADVLPPEQAAEVVARYPHLPHGAPVIWPQQPGVPAYHNLGIWPFVTAYWLRAAKKVGNAVAVEHGVRSLMRGAALNLSNMENLEVVSGSAAGTVLNSQRQLWSVAGYLSMVHDVLFGLEVGPVGIRFQPFLPRSLRRTLFASAETLVLNDFPFRGKRLTVVLRLPQPGAEDDQGAYVPGRARLDGRDVAADAFLHPDELAPQSLLEIELVDGPVVPSSITLVTDTADHRALYGPQAPQITGVELRDGRVVVSFAAGGGPAAEIALDVYRDGELRGHGLPGDATSWTDEDSAGEATPSHCYVVAARYTATGNHSQHSAPWCYWGPGYERAQVVPAADFQSVGGHWVFNHGRWHYQEWGDPGHTLTVPELRSAFDGDHLLQVAYGNGAGPVSTGITCGVKRITVEDALTREQVGSGLLLMPHLGGWERWADSSFVPVRLQAGRAYRIIILGDERTVNMSSFQHFASYTGTGGAGGTFARVNISELKVLALGR